MEKLKVIVTQADCRRDTFRCGGKGGQNLQKRDTGVRWTHPPSGAVGESREERSQLQNEKTAWRRMAETLQFKSWCSLQLQMLEEGYRNVEAKVDRMMAREEDFVVEIEDAEKCVHKEAACDKKERQ